MKISGSAQPDAFPLASFSESGVMEYRARTFSPVLLDDGQKPDQALLEMEDRLGHADEIGRRNGSYVDSISNTFALEEVAGGKPQASEYICTFGGRLEDDFGKVNFDFSSEAKSEADVHGYCIQIAVGSEYQQVIIRPDKRSQAKTIHQAAVTAYQARADVSEISEAIKNTARALGVEVF